MTVQAPANAAPWAHSFAQTIQRGISECGPLFISLKPFTVAQLTAGMATQFPWKLAFVSNGAGNKFVAVSNGTAFYYLEGTAV